MNIFRDIFLGKLSETMDIAALDGWKHAVFNASKEL